jgi:hypothetical protein
MKTGVWRHIVVSVLMLGLATPGLALGDGSGKGCQFHGTWFGFDPGTGALTGWMVTAAGQASNAGTNNLEFPIFNPTLSNLFPDATAISTLRGSWVRTGGNTFDYTMIGVATDVARNVVWIGKLSGHITLSADCNTETIEDTTLEVFAPDENPYTGTRMELPYGVPNPIPQPTHYGFRTSVDLPDLD